MIQLLSSLLSQWGVHKSHFYKLPFHLIWYREIGQVSVQQGNNVFYVRIKEKSNRFILILVTLSRVHLAKPDS